MSAPTPHLDEVHGAWRYEESRWAGAGVVPFGEEVLHQPTSEIVDITPTIEAISDYMIEVMHARSGIGLAANQIGLPLRMFVHNLPKVVPMVIINPRIISIEGMWTYEEGCLSMTLDDTRARVFRPQRIVVEAQDLRGAALRIAADELLARVFQHEIDHLDGIVFAQRLRDPERDVVFRAMGEAGVDLRQLPVVPYDLPVADG